jgi:hypothetical protein
LYFKQVSISVAHYTLLSITTNGKLGNQSTHKIYMGVHVSGCYFCTVSTNLEFSGHIVAKPPVQTLMKSHPSRAELFYTNDWTDKLSHNNDNDNSHFLQLCQYPKIESSK